MQSLQEKAAQWSGVDTADAFAIDDTNLFQKLGLQTFVNLSTNFYNRYGCERGTLFLALSVFFYTMSFCLMQGL